MGWLTGHETSASFYTLYHRSATFGENAAELLRLLTFGREEGLGSDRREVAEERVVVCRDVLLLCVLGFRHTHTYIHTYTHTPHTHTHTHTRHRLRYSVSASERGGNNLLSLSRCTPVHARPRVRLCTNSILAIFLAIFYSRFLVVKGYLTSKKTHPTLP